MQPTLLRQNSTFVAEAATPAEQIAPSFSTGMIGLRQRLLLDRDGEASL
jgi:hypothetical protein